MIQLGKLKDSDNRNVERGFDRRRWRNSMPSNLNTDTTLQNSSVVMVWIIAFPDSSNDALLFCAHYVCRAKARQPNWLSHQFVLMIYEGLLIAHSHEDYIYLLASLKSTRVLPTTKLGKNGKSDHLKMGQSLQKTTCKGRSALVSWQWGGSGGHDLEEDSKASAFTNSFLEI